MYVLHVAEYSNVGGDPDATELLIPNHIPELEKRARIGLGKSLSDCARLESMPILSLLRAELIKTS
jgi:hypothetical protein